jgi:hypothetical protein
LEVNLICLEALRGRFFGLAARATSLGGALSSYRNDVKGVYRASLPSSPSPFLISRFFQFSFEIGLAFPPSNSVWPYPSCNHRSKKTGEASEVTGWKALVAQNGQ